MDAAEKRTLYQQSIAKITALVSGETDTLLIMSSMVAVLKQSFPQFYWIGFYRVIENKQAMIIGPYQGTPACLHIPFERGVCGKAATLAKTQIIADVDSFPGHIACDPISRSEIVVPIINQQNQLIAVLDVDSSTLASFDELDKEMLEGLCNTLFQNASYI